jgi:hypothetical protein
VTFDPLEEERRRAEIFRRAEEQAQQTAAAIAALLMDWSDEARMRIVADALTKLCNVAPPPPRRFPT